MNHAAGMMKKEWVISARLLHSLNLIMIYLFSPFFDYPILRQVSREVPGSFGRRFS